MSDHKINIHIELIILTPKHPFLFFMVYSNISMSFKPILFVLSESILSLAP